MVPLVTSRLVYPLGPSHQYFVCVFHEVPVRKTIKVLVQFFIHAELLINGINSKIFAHFSYPLTYLEMAAVVDRSKTKHRALEKLTSSWTLSPTLAL